MNKVELARKLRRQLELLEEEGEFEVQAFDVWAAPDFLGEALVRVEENAWSSGYCMSETCAHNSHDPYSEGDTAFVLCRPVGEDEEGNDLYEAKGNGIVFGYRYAKDNGFHFAPTARIFLVE